MSKVFIILGQMPDFRNSDSMVGLLFGAEHPTGKQLKAMGFGRIQQIDQAVPVSAPENPILYMFERSPSANEVHIAEVCIEGKKASLGKKETRKGEPHSIVPEVKGELAQRLMSPRNGLSTKDFPRRDCQEQKTKRFART